MQRFAQCMEIWKKVPKFCHSHISQSRWNCGSITVMNFLSYHNYTTQLFRKLFLTKFSQNSYLNYHWFYSKVSTHNFTKRTIEIISHWNIFAFIFCVDLVTPESLWRHKGVAMHVTDKTMHRFSTMIRHLPLRNFARKFRLSNVLKPNHSCHNRI